MRTLNLKLEESDQPVYQRISDAVRQSLKSGTLTLGELLPSTRELGRQLQVHRHTVSRALDDLVAEGWLEAERGRGYRVVAPPSTDFEPVNVAWPKFSVLEGLSDKHDGDFLFASGKPDLRLFPTEEFFRTLRGQLRDIPPEQLLGYADPAGSLNFRKRLKTYLARMRGLARGQVVVTHGSQEAIFLLGQLFCKGQRRKVAVEASGYPPAWDALRLSGAELVGLPVDDQGLNVEALENLAKQEPPALLYLTPLHQYPTTATLSLERRQHLLSVIQEYQIPVIEDDYDHEFHYSGRPNLPLAGEDESGLVMYVSTFSKLVYPSARLGFCLVPDDLLEPICRLKRCTTRQNDLLLQETMAAWMEQGGLERHLRRMRKVYGQRLQVMCDKLDELGFHYHRPNGGMSVWVDVGHNSDLVAKKAEALGLPVRPSRYYFLDQKQGPGPHLRLGFASMNEEEIRKGLDILKRACLSMDS